MDGISFLFGSPIHADYFCEWCDEKGIGYELNGCIVTIDDCDCSDDIYEAVAEYFGVVIDDDEEED